MAGLMIIPAVFAFSGGDAATLKSGPALMFITIPKVFANMGFGTAIGIVFFLISTVRSCDKFYCTDRKCCFNVRR